MIEPTEAQIKEFWEWCGLELLRASDNDYHWFNVTSDGDYDIVSPVDSDMGLPVIDLNNLFKWVPDIIVGVYFRFFPGGCECELTYITEAGFDTVKSWIKNDTGDEKRSKELAALALFWALDKVRRSLNE